MSENKLSNIRKDAIEGCIASFYTLEGFFCRIYPVFAIDKVKVSFAKKGANGKGFDIYVDILNFALWCKDIENGRFFTILEAEKKNGVQFPDYYKYVTGDSGEKSVGFCNSTVAGNIAINGKVSKEDHGTIPIPKNELRKMAMLFNISTRKYFDELEDVIRKAAENTASFYNNIEPTAAVATNKSAPTTQEQKNKGAVQEYLLTSLGQMEQFTINNEVNSPCFKLKAKDHSGNEYEVQFLSGFVKKSRDLFNKFADYLQANPVGTPLRIMAKAYTYNGVNQLQFQHFVREVM